MDLLRHKKASLNYEILEQFEAGIELLGYEVKSVRVHQGSLEGARAAVRGGEAFLIGATIPAYQPANTPKEYDPERPRRLLLNKKELEEILGAESRKGLTVVPISMYNKGRKVKVAIAIVRGKKKFDKREDLKKRDTDREMQRTLKEE